MQPSYQLKQRDQKRRRRMKSPRYKPLTNLAVKILREETQGERLTFEECYIILAQNLCVNDNRTKSITVRVYDRI